MEKASTSTDDQLQAEIKGLQIANADLTIERDAARLEVADLKEALARRDILVADGTMIVELVDPADE